MEYKQDPRLAGMDERRELRKVARVLGRGSQVSGADWLRLLLLLEAREVCLNDELEAVLKRALKKHDEDTQVQKLAAIHDSNRRGL